MKEGEYYQFQAHQFTFCLSYDYDYSKNGDFIVMDYEYDNQVSGFSKGKVSKMQRVSKGLEEVLQGLQEGTLVLWNRDLDISCNLEGNTGLEALNCFKISQISNPLFFLNLRVGQGGSQRFKGWLTQDVIDAHNFIKNHNINNGLLYMPQSYASEDPLDEYMGYIKHFSSVYIQLTNEIFEGLQSNEEECITLLKNYKSFLLDSSLPEVIIIEVSLEGDDSDGPPEIHKVYVDKIDVKEASKKLDEFFEYKKSSDSSEEDD